MSQPEEVTSQTLDLFVDSIIAKLIQDALAKSKGKVAEAAKILRIKRRKLYYFLEHHPELFPNLKDSKNFRMH